MWGGGQEIGSGPVCDVGRPQIPLQWCNGEYPWKDTYTKVGWVLRGVNRDWHAMMHLDAVYQVQDL